VTALLSPYTSGNIPCDIHLFGALKVAIRGANFEVVADVILEERHGDLNSSRTGTSRVHMTLIPVGVIPKQLEGIYIGM
jgi:hypothetical protein